MKKKLIVRAFVKMLSGGLALGILLFPTAGTFQFAGAWRMILFLILPMLIMGICLLLKAPELLEKRLSTDEKEPEQKKVILYSSLMFTLSFVLCGLDYRFQWAQAPDWLVIASCLVFLLTYAGFGELLRENEYLSRTVEVQEGQQVICTGLYGIVRHPMYMIITFMFLSMPLIIGSLVGVLPLLFLPVILVKRIQNEEKVLEEGLQGYREYKQNVKYRMIPFIW